jgi:hypothetical protein
MYRRLIGAFAAAAVCAAAYQVAPAFSQGGMVLMIEINRSNSQPTRPSAPVDTLKDFTDALRHCYSPAPIDDVSQPVDLTFQVSSKRFWRTVWQTARCQFRANRFTEERQRYYLAVAEAVDLCSPMPFTDAMGGASAGRTFRISIIDSRNRRQA